MAGTRPRSSDASDSSRRRRSPMSTPSPARAPVRLGSTRALLRRWRCDSPVASLAHGGPHDKLRALSMEPRSSSCYGRPAAAYFARADLDPADSRRTTGPREGVQVAVDDLAAHAVASANDGVARTPSCRDRIYMFLLFADSTGSVSSGHEGPYGAFGLRPRCASWRGEPSAPDSYALGSIVLLSCWSWRACAFGSGAPPRAQGGVPVRLAFRWCGAGETLTSGSSHGWRGHPLIPYVRPAWTARVGGPP